MYAVIKAGSRQFKVAKGDSIELFKVNGKSVGDTIDFNEVLMVGGESTKVGAPLVKGAKVVGKITKQEKSPKILVFKYRRRKNYKKTIGHRQDITTVEISDIVM